MSSINASERKRINDLRSRQLNPCDDLFWKSRGYLERPCNWRDILDQQSEDGDYENDYYNDDDNEYYDDEYYDDEYYDDEYYGDEYYDNDDNEYNDDDDEYSSDDDEDDSYEYYANCHIKSLQNNPNNIEYWRVRGWSDRPDDWHERVYGY